MHSSSFFLALALATAPIAAIAQDAPTGRVAVVVAIATPPGITDERLRAEFDKAVPRYQQIPGLIRKYFTLQAGKFGGIYYWTSKAAAQAWFNDAWTARAKATYGTTPEISYYDVPLAIDGAKP